MATQILSLHWKAARWALLPFVIAAFGLPLLTVQGLGGDLSGYGPSALDLVRANQFYAPLFPLMAAIVGTVVALTAWNWDHRGDHVYALSLPLARWEYALLKLGAGAVLLGIPAAALLMGSLVATASVDLPYGLSAYPFAVSARFLLACLLAYGVLFAMAAGSTRTAVILLSTVVGGLVLGEIGVDFVGEHYVPALRNASLVEMVLHRLTAWPGPLQVFFGDWMLIDV